MNLIQKIKFINKANKAYKAIKKLIAEKQGVADDAKKIIADLLQIIDSCAGILPEFKETFNELKEIIKNAF